MAHLNRMWIGTVLDLMRILQMHVQINEINEFEFGVAPKVQSLAFTVLQAFALF